MTVKPRQNRSDRRRLLPIIAAAFAELGYRRATTAQLAKRCGVRENILYRAWPSKKVMFLSSIEYVFSSSMNLWRKLAANGDPREAAQRILDYESTHHGEHGLYRVIFAGLNESDDPDIRAALCRMYLHFQQFIASQLRAAVPSSAPRLADPDVAAWTLVGIGTLSNITRELGLLSATARRRLFQQIGRLLLNGTVP